MTNATATATATAKLAYTVEQGAELCAAYEAAKDNDSRSQVVEAFAVKFGKTTKSIIAKLSREKVYVKAERLTKSGQAVQKKEELADFIGKMLPELSENDISSLSKATKPALQILFKALANSVPVTPENSPKAE